MKKVTKIVIMAMLLLPVSKSALPSHGRSRSTFLGCWSIGLGSMIAGGLYSGWKTNEILKKSKNPIWDHPKETVEIQCFKKKLDRDRRKTSIRNGILGGLICGTVGFLTSFVCSVCFKLI